MKLGDFLLGLQLLTGAVPLLDLTVLIGRYCNWLFYSHFILRIAVLWRGEAAWSIISL